MQDDAEEEHAVESFPCPSDDCDVVLSTKECLRYSEGLDLGCYFLILIKTDAT